MGTLFAHIRFHTTFCAAEKNRAFGRSVLISLLRGRNRKRDLAVGPIRLLSNPPSKKEEEEEEEEEEEDHLSTFSHLVLSTENGRDSPPNRGRHYLLFHQSFLTRFPVSFA